MNWNVLSVLVPVLWSGKRLIIPEELSWIWAPSSCPTSVYWILRCWFIFLRCRQFWSCALPHDSHCLLDVSRCQAVGDLSKVQRRHRQRHLHKIHFVFVYIVALWRYKPFPRCRPEVVMWDESSRLFTQQVLLCHISRYVRLCKVKSHQAANE